MSALIQAAYVVRRRVFGWLQLRTRGVKAMLFNDVGEILLIRNSYGDRDVLVLPGGGIGRHEEAADAAAREVMEEVGLGAVNLKLFAIYLSGAEGKRDTISLFIGAASGVPSTDSIEIEEAGFYGPDDLPTNVSPATLRRIEEVSGNRPIDGHW